MKVKVKELMTDDAIKYGSFFGCIDTLKGYLEEEIVGSDGSDGTEYALYFNYKGSPYMIEIVRYKLAGFTDLWELYESNPDIEVTLTPVKKVTKTIEVWEEV